MGAVLKKIICPPSLKGYPGNKGANGVYQKLINRVPELTRVIELCAGSAQLSCKMKRPPLHTILVDMDYRVIDAWKKQNNKDVTAIHLNAVKFLEKYLASTGKTKTDFFYVDAPYVFSARRSGNKIYRHEMTDQDHIDLLKLLRTVKCNCMISNYNNPIYNRMLKKWHRYEFKVMTHQGPATEVIWMNYPTPEVLHDYSFVGADCWKRQGVTRKIIRLSNKLRALSALERNAIIARALKK
jgi:DNA adenine methylase